MNIPQTVKDYLDSLDENVEIMNLINNELTYLPDLSRFKNLKRLVCSYNKIKKLDILPKGLIQLYCSDNQIQELNNIPEPLILDCRYNLLPSFDIQILKKIDIDRRKEKLVMFILSMSKSEFSFDKDDMLEKIGKYVLT